MRASLYQGLSLDQAPPISVPFSFYLVGALMGIVSGIVAGYVPDLRDRWNPLMMVLAHSYLVGFIGFVMIGSLFQMLPVVAGVTVRNPVLHAAILLILLSLGVVGLMAGLPPLNWSGWREIVIALFAALTYFLLLFFARLRQVNSSAPAVLGMKLAGVSLFCVMVLGTVFVFAFSGLLPISGFRPLLTDAHLSWGVAGWMGFLIQGVLCQVIPMFFVTPPFSKQLIRGQMRVLFFALTAKTFLVLFGLLNAVLLMMLDLLLYGSLLFGASYSLRLSFRRKRKVRDLSLALIRFGLGSVIAAIPLLFWAETPVWNELAFQVIVLFGVTSIVLGMLFKIIPFLVWFHLQAQAMNALLSGKNVAIPTMKEIVSDNTLRLQIVLHLTTLLGYVWGFWRGATQPLAVAVILSFSFLVWVIASSWWRYMSLSTGIQKTVFKHP